MIKKCVNCRISIVTLDSEDTENMCVDCRAIRDDINYFGIVEDYGFEEPDAYCEDYIESRYDCEDY